MREFDISRELWREYDFGGRVYRITDPVTLYIREDGKGTCHRVVDSKGVAHCAPAVGFMGCVVRWKNPDGEPPVNF